MEITVIALIVMGALLILFSKNATDRLAKKDEEIESLKSEIERLKTGGAPYTFKPNKS